jgi:hypothetical protein
MKKTTYHSNDDELGGNSQPHYLRDVDGNRLECSFDPENARRYGIPVKASCGILYALCPKCNTPWGKGWWILLNDARKCCSNRDTEQEELDQTELEKERAVLLRASMLMKPYYAVVSKSRTKAEAWIKFNEIDPDRVILIENNSDIKKVRLNKHKFDIVFLGKRNNYLTHPALNNSFILEELEEQEALRSHQYIILYTDRGSQKESAKTMIIPIKSRESFDRLLDRLTKENNKAQYPVEDMSLKLFIRKGHLRDSEVYSPEDTV